MRLLIICTGGGGGGGLEGVGNARYMYLTSKKKCSIFPH